MDQLLELPWMEIILSVTVVIGLVIALPLLINKYPASRSLGLVVLSYLVLTVISIALLAYLLPATTITSILLALYTKTLFAQKTRGNKVHFISIIGIVLFSLLPIPLLAIRIALTLIALFYLYQTYTTLNQEGKNRGISWWQNPGSRMKWFRNYVILNSLVILSLLGLADWLSVLHASLFSLLIIGYTVYQIIQESAFFAPPVLANKYKKSTLTAEQKHSILSKLDELIKVEKFYLDDSVSMSKVAADLHTTTHHLSQVINESKGITFQNLVSRYRIDEAKILLKDKQYKYTTIENVAAMVGYNSKSSFNTAFKKQTGLTPTEYREVGGVRFYREAHSPDRKLRFSGQQSVSLDHVLSPNYLYNMVTNFLKVFTRTLAKNKVFSLLNVFGLTVGFTCSILIYLFVTDELSYDKEIPDAERIYRVALMNDNPQTRTPHPMAQALVTDMPEVESAVSISPWYGPGLNLQSLKVKNVETNALFEEPDFFFADSTFFDVFDLEIVAGDKDALSKPWGFIITEEMAKKYFGDENPIGKQMEVDANPLEVFAVVKSLPEKSHFHFNALLSYVSLKTLNPNNPWFKWEDFGHFNYLKLSPDASVIALESKMPDWVAPFLDWKQSDLNDLADGSIKLALQPITDIHLDSHLRWELENNGNSMYVYILIGTLVFLLLIVTINYVNLTTAKSVERAKEVGVRKTLGAMSNTLKVQFYVESFLFCLFSLVLAFGISTLLLNLFSELTNKDFIIGDLFNVSFLIKALGGSTLIALLAGFYPSLVLTNISPAEVIKGKTTESGSNTRVRGLLVVLQFAISAILIVGSMVILKQIDFILSKELGFDKEAVISVKVHQSVEYGGINLEQVQSLKSEFLKISGVVSTSTISNLPGEQFNQNPVFPKNDPDRSSNASEMYVDFGADEVLALEIVDGRNFDRSHAEDVSGNTFIVNERLVKDLGLDEPIGTELVWDNDWRQFKGLIVGVAKDFHFESLHENIRPLIIKIDPQNINHIIIKVEGQNFESTLTQLKSTYQTFEEELPFEYYFLDDQLAELYDAEVRTLNIFSVFAGIALALACLGLFGMAIAMLHQRMKEVGIRKILGASSPQIMAMVIGQFSKLIGVALLIGMPIGYFLIENWLAEFSYRTAVGFLPFVATALVLLFVAIASVSAVIARIATTNPVETLNRE